VVQWVTAEVDVRKGILHQSPVTATC